MNELTRIGESEVLSTAKEFIQEIETIKSLKVSEITTAEDNVKASDFLGRAKFLIKFLDDKRTERKEPFLTEGKRVDAVFKPWINSMTEAKEKLEKAMKTFALAEIARKEAAIRAAREAEIKRLEEEKQKMLDMALAEAEKAKTATGKDKVQNECMEAITLSQAEAIEQDQTKIAEKEVKGIARTLGGDGGMSSSKFWNFEIINPKLVTREYCEPVNKLIKAGVDSGVREIPGVRIFEDVRFTNR